MVKSGEVRRVPVREVDPIPGNVRKMTEEEFNALCRSIEENGYVEPIQVVEKCGGGYRIVNGQHRFEALTEVFGVTEIDVMVVGRECCRGEKPEETGCWDELRYWTEVLRLNNIRGDWVKPEVAKRIVWLWERYRKKGMTLDEFKERVGFVGRKTLVDKLLADVKKSLPKDIAKKLDEVRDEIETVEDLSRVINRIMSEAKKRGLDSGFIVFQLYGYEHIMVKSTEELYTLIREVAELAAEKGVRLADVLYLMLTEGKSPAEAIDELSGVEK